MTAFTPTDMRRAAVMLQHYGTRNKDGVAAIMLEANEAGQALDLAGAMCMLCFQIVPILWSEEGEAALRQLSEAWANSEAEHGRTAI